MRSTALPLSSYDASTARLALDTFAEGIDTGRFNGLTDREPMVAAMLWLLEQLAWRPSTLSLVHALPHQPEQFTLADLRATLMRLEIASTESRLGKRQLTDLPLPALLITARGQALVLEEEPETGAVAFDPVTGEEVVLTHDPTLKVITFHRPTASAQQGFTRSLARRFNQTAFTLIAIKGGLNALALSAILALVMIYDTVIPARANDTLMALAIAIGCALCLDIFLRRMKARLLSRTAARMEYIIATRAFRKVLSLPFDKIAGGSIAQQAGRLKQFSVISSVLSGPAAEVALELPFTVLMTFALFAIAGPIGFVPIVIFTLLALTAFVLGPRLRRLGATARIAREEHDQIVSDIILETDAIRDAGAQDVWEARARQSALRHAQAQRKVDATQMALDRIGAMAAPLAGGATAILGTYLAIEGSLSPGVLIGALVLTWRIVAPLQAMLLLIAKWVELMRMGGQLDRLMTLPEDRTSDELPLSFNMQGQISFKGLVVRYPSLKEPALRGITADLPAGALIALTGPSGSGKTSLLRALLGLVKPISGAILIDGVNLSQIPQSQLRQMVSFAPQVSHLVHGTIAQNLRLTRPLASDEELMDMLEELGLAQAVTALPEGLETRLTKAVQAALPGGFKQSLVLAQALLRQPRILLLDEPARLLDPTLEAAMMAALNRRRGDMTILMVTHRPSHIQGSDLELSLEAGAIRHLRQKKEMPA